MLILKCRIWFILQCFALFPQRFESLLLFFMNYFNASSNIQLYYQTNLSPNNSVTTLRWKSCMSTSAVASFLKLTEAVGFCHSHFHLRWSFITLLGILQCQTYFTTNSSIYNFNIKSSIKISIYFTFLT